MDKPKYKVVSTIFASKIYRDHRKDGGCFYEHFMALLKALNPDEITDIIDSDRFLAWAEEDYGRIEFLLKHGYIKEVQSEYDKWADEMPDRKHRLSSMNDKLMEWVSRMPRD